MCSLPTSRGVAPCFLHTAAATGGNDHPRAGVHHPRPVQTDMRTAEAAAGHHQVGEVSDDLIGWDDLSTIFGYLSQITSLDADTDLVEEFIPYDPLAFPQRFCRLTTDFGP